MKAFMPIGPALKFKALADNSDMLPFLRHVGALEYLAPPATEPPRP
jgi:hypothetical protein